MERVMLAGIAFDAMPLANEVYDGVGTKLTMREESHFYRGQQDPETRNVLRWVLDNRDEIISFMRKHQLIVFAREGFHVEAPRESWFHHSRGTQWFSRSNNAQAAQWWHRDGAHVLGFAHGSGTRVPTGFTTRSAIVNAVHEKAPSYMIPSVACSKKRDMLEQTLQHSGEPEWAEPVIYSLEYSSRVDSEHVEQCTDCQAVQQSAALFMHEVNQLLLKQRKVYEQWWAPDNSIAVLHEDNDQGNDPIKHSRNPRDVRTTVAGTIWQVTLNSSI